MLWLPRGDRTRFSLSTEPYLFAKNNPLLFQDPLGLIVTAADRKRIAEYKARLQQHRAAGEADAYREVYNQLRSFSTALQNRQRWWDLWTGGIEEAATIVQDVLGIPNYVSSDYAKTLSSDQLAVDTKIDREGQAAIESLRKTADAVHTALVVAETAGDLASTATGVGGMVKLAAKTGVKCFAKILAKQMLVSYAAGAAVDHVAAAAGIDPQYLNAASSIFGAPSWRTGTKIAPGTACFVAGTLVHTEEGLKAIETIDAGQRVWACDPATGEWSLRDVLEPLAKDWEGDLVTLVVAGEAIQATGNHPFWVVAGKDLESRPYPEELREERPPALRGRWVEARDLLAGDTLLLRDGRLERLALASSRQAQVRVYNLHVRGLHTYAVANAGVVVHNTKGTCGRRIWGTDRIHGNDLRTSKPAVGYSLRDRTTGEVLKYGETTRGERRYSKKYLREHNARFKEELSGTKAEMHQWQHERILEYKAQGTGRPRLNKSDW